MPDHTFMSTTFQLIVFPGRIGYESSGKAENLNIYSIVFLCMKNVKNINFLVIFQN